MATKKTAEKTPKKPTAEDRASRFVYQAGEIEWDPPKEKPKKTTKK